MAREPRASPEAWQTVISDDLRRRAVQLLAANWSIRAVSRELNISRSAVARASEWPRNARLFGGLRTGERLLEAPVRCPGCGGKIWIVPCRLDGWLFPRAQAG